MAEEDGSGQKKEFSLVWVSCPCEEDGDSLEKMIDLALTKGLAGALNRIKGCDSHYFFDGKIERSSEQLLIFKTTTALTKELGEHISKYHPYDSPEIFSLRIENGNHSFFDAIHKACKSSPTPSTSLKNSP